MNALHSIPHASAALDKRGGRLIAGDVGNDVWCVSNAGGIAQAMVTR
jgi:hypothetical protein